MTRISSLIVASTLAILPVGAFAQQTATPDKTSGPTSLTTAMPNTGNTVTDKTSINKTGTDKTVTGTTAMDKVTTPTPAATANTTQPAKTDAKNTGHGAKNDVHGMNSGSAPHAKAGVPAKS